VVANGLPLMLLLFVLENGPTLIASFFINLVTTFDAFTFSCFLENQNERSEAALCAHGRA
jgi:hypothetical protein